MAAPQGFPNLGATCWLNSLLQSLRSLKCLATHYEMLTPMHVYRSKLLPLKLLRGGQQSASEGLVYLLEHDNLDRYFKLRISEINICSECNYRTSKNDIRVHLNLFDETSLRELGFKKSLSLQKSTVPGYVCSECKKKTTIKRYDYTRHVSKVIVVLFNRYGTRSEIAYPAKFEFSNHTYQMRAQVIHSGSLRGGHYIAQGKRGDKIYVFNDSSVREIEEFSITPNAYMVFYECDCPNHGKSLNRLTSAGK